MRRYGRSGWYGERHRHYLASQGISTAVRKKNKSILDRYGSNKDWVFEVYVDKRDGSLIAYVDPNKTDNYAAPQTKIDDAKGNIVKVKKEDIRNYFARYDSQWRNNFEYVLNDVKPVAEVSISDDKVNEFKMLVKKNDLIAINIFDDFVGGKIFVIAKKDNEDAARYVAEAFEEGEGDYDPKKVGRVLGYPEEAINEWSKKNEIVRQELKKPVEQRTETWPYMREGRDVAEKAGVSKEDLELLEFLPSSNVEETKEAIAKRKKALGEDE